MYILRDAIYAIGVEHHRYLILRQYPRRHGGGIRADPHPQPARQTAARVMLCSRRPIADSAIMPLSVSSSGVMICSIR